MRNSPFPSLSVGYFKKYSVSSALSRAAVCSEAMKSEPRLFYCDNRSSSNQRPAHAFLQHYSPTTGRREKPRINAFFFNLPTLVDSCKDDQVSEPQEVKVGNITTSPGVIKELH